jgi:hypothetical protein
MKTTKEGALRAMYSKPDGRERSINDAVYFGVGEYPYAAVFDLKKAQCKFTPSHNSAWGYLSDRKEAAKFLDWLYREDKYFYIYT